MKRDDLKIRRILVAFDASHHSEVALLAAMDLATRTNAEVIGLFVEDDNLLRLAQLPFAREVSSWARPRSLNREAMERALRAQAVRLRRAMRTAAESRQISWQFRVLRGNVAGELLKAERECDMLVIGQSGRRSTHLTEPGATAVAIATRGAKIVVVQHPTSHNGRPLLVLFDGSPAAWRALAVAFIMRPTNSTEVTLLMPSTLALPGDQLETELEQWLAERNHSASRVRLRERTLESLSNTARQHNACGLVLSQHEDAFEETAIRLLLTTLNCPVVLVR